MTVSDLTDDEFRERVMATFIYRHPARDRKMRSRRGLATALGLLAVVGVYFAFVVLAPMLAISGQTVAGTGPKTVWGYVYDSNGAKVNGILVTVAVEDPVGSQRATESCISGTGTDGFYTVSFDESDWFVGDTIHVSADYDTETAENTTLIVDEGAEIVDLHFTSVIIPEFSFGVTAVAAISLLVMTTVAIRHRGQRGK